MDDDDKKVVALIIFAGACVMRGLTNSAEARSAASSAYLTTDQALADSAKMWRGAMAEAEKGP